MKGITNPVIPPMSEKKPKMLYTVRVLTSYLSFKIKLNQIKVRLLPALLGLIVTDSDVKNLVMT